MPSAFQAVWNDSNSLGTYSGNLFLPVTGSLLWLLGPVMFAKIYAALILFLVGCSAGFFFHQLRLAPAACVIGGLAAALNSTFFSSACWGNATHEVAIAMSFLAMAAVVGGGGWIRLVLAGLAVGVGVMEAADIGAIFSLYVAVFIFYHSFPQGKPTVRDAAFGVGKVTVVAVFALFVAAHSVTTLVSTQIKGVAGAQQDTQSKWERWDWATQWSLPKREALGLVVPGLFGFRMDTPVGLPEGVQESLKGGQYWGFVGLDPAWYRFWDHHGERPGGAPRGFSGGGIYAGTLVSLIAIWAAVQSFRKKDSVFSPPTCRLLWFWVGVVVISLLLSFGRFAPFYRILYALPYFSTIRNPGKFLFPMSVALLVLFAYGVEGLWRRYMETPAATAAFGLVHGVKTWWRESMGFDKRWTRWSLAALAAFGLGWLIYASSREGLEKYLQELHYDSSTAAAIAGFSSGQVGRSVLFFGIAICLVTLVLSGVLSGRRAKWGVALLGLFLAVDLCLADRPWIIVWNYKLKYATDPVIEMLAKQPYEHRVALRPRYFPQVFTLPQQVAENDSTLGQYEGIEWAQHHFLYYNIQALDIIQMPRMPEDLLAYEISLTPRSGADLGHIVARKWELTNTRYIIGAAEYLDVLNGVIDPGKQRFRIAKRFALAPKAAVAQPVELQHLTAVEATNGPFAVFDFTGALPRAKLYSHWETATNDQQLVSQLKADVQQWLSQKQTNAVAQKELQSLAHMGTNDYLTLKKLASPSFAPDKTVLLAAPLAAPVSGATTNAGKVEFVSYAPKDIVLKAEAASPSVLLLNDRYDGNWKVLVDGKPQTLLRCNYIMRGVHLQPGMHTVEFQFRPPIGSFYISLGAIVIGVLLCAILVVWPKPDADVLSGLDNVPRAPAKQASAARNPQR